MNRRSFLKALGISSVAMKPTIEEVGGKLMTNGLPVAKANEYGAAVAECSSLGMSNSTLQNVRKASEWILSNGLPEYLKREASQSFDRYPHIPPHIAALRSMSPVMKLHLAKQEHIARVEDDYKQKGNRITDRESLPDFVKGLYL